MATVSTSILVPTVPLIQDIYVKRYCGSIPMSAGYYTQAGCMYKQCNNPNTVCGQSFPI